MNKMSLILLLSLLQLVFLVDIGHKNARIAIDLSKSRIDEENIMNKSSEVVERLLRRGRRKNGEDFAAYVTATYGSTIPDAYRDRVWNAVDNMMENYKAGVGPHCWGVGLYVVGNWEGDGGATAAPLPKDVEGAKYNDGADAAIEEAWDGATKDAYGRVTHDSFIRALEGVNDNLKYQGFLERCFDVAANMMKDKTYAGQSVGRHCFSVGAYLARNFELADDSLAGFE